MIRTLLLLVLLAFAGQTPAAETRYVTDSLSVAIRSGQSTRHKILRMVPSGTPVTVLEQSEEGYSRVRVPQGTEGWMLTRQLMEQPSARDRLASAEARQKALESENQDLKQEAETLVATRDSLLECGQELDQIRGTAARTLEIQEQNSRLRQELSELKQEMDKLTLENTGLRSAAERNWFVAGASVSIGSLILGLILPHLPWRRKRRWDQF